MSARTQTVGVHRIACRGPADLSGVQALVEAGTLRPQDIVAVMGKTEGNGCVNDHTREYAAMAWGQWLAGHLGCSADEAAQRVALVMSGVYAIHQSFFEIFLVIGVGVFGYAMRWLKMPARP